MKEIINKTKTKTLLFVEDTEMLRETMMQVFSHFFGKIIVAENGKEGLEYYHKHKDEIDIIITDLDMPHMNGDEMITIIRENCKEIPIIVSSGRENQTDLEEFASAFVPKPIDLRLFIDTLKTLCKL
jgi:CheY-like chemotaxis protein